MRGVPRVPVSLTQARRSSVNMWTADGRARGSCVCCREEGEGQAKAGLAASLRPAPGQLTTVTGHGWVEAHTHGHEHRQTDGRAH